MSRSQHLRDADIRGLIRLVREVCELGEDAQGWRLHMLTALRQILGAGVSCHYFHDLPVDVASTRLRDYIDVAAEPLWHEYIARTDVSPDPISPGIARLLGRSFVRSEDQLCTTREWHSSEFVNDIMRPLRADHEMASIVVLPNGRSFSALGFGRYLGDDTFSARERRVLHLFHLELVELWRTPHLGNGHDTSALAPRLRQTLDLLRKGLSEKQIALQLGLSAHTVHDYVKDLHRRFEVHSTPELVAMTRATSAFRPTLSFS